MSRSRFLVLLAIILGALVLTGCNKEKESVVTAVAVPEDGAAAGASRPGPQPRLRFDGPTGAAPEKLVIEFREDVFSHELYGQPFEETVLTFDPPVAGTLSLYDLRSVHFVPTVAFAPGTRYRARLEAIETGAGLLEPAADEEWTVEATTSDFEFTRLSLVGLKAQPRRAQVELVFTGSVTPEEVRRYARFELVDEAKKAGSRIAEVQFSAGRERHIVNAFLPNRGLLPGTRLELTLEGGVRSTAEREGRAAAATASVHFGREPNVKIVDVYRAESDNGFYLQVVCDDESLDGKFYFYDQARGRYWELSQRCMPDEDAAREAIVIEPAVDFTVSPGRGGFRVFGNFEKGEYTFSMRAGLRTVDGGVLPNLYESRIEIPRRTPRVSFVSQGRYLPRSAWQLLPVKHLNYDRARLDIRHVPPENLVFWMSDDDDEGADERDSNLVHSSALPLSGPEDAEVTSYLDLTTYVSPATRGLLELKIADDKARILLTDLHLVAKRTPAGQVAVWVLDMHSLEPIGGVEIKLVRKSGYVMSRCRTTGDGGCELLAGDSVDPSPPFALIASRDDDLTYLKFADLKAEVQEERIAGEPYRGGRKYRAAVYSERGVYRPGETAHLAAIVRGENNKAPEAGMPLQAKLIDPRGKTAKNITLKTNTAGYATLDLPFAAFATTGRYDLQLDAAGVRVGEHSFQVEEFVPERMKVEAAAEAPSYLLGDEVSVAVEARYLFGGVPKNHRLELRCDLEPASFAPAENANYHYGVWTAGAGPERGVTLGTSSGTLDENGAGLLACAGRGRSGGFAGPARLVARAAVFESGSGRTTVGSAVVPVHPAEHYVGLSSGTTKVKAGEDLVIDGVTVDWDGKPTTGAPTVEIELVRLVTEYGWYFNSTTGSWTNRRQQRPMTEEKTTAAVTNGKFQVTFKPRADGESFLVRARSGSARTDLELEGEGFAYWYSPEEQGERTPKPGRATWIALETPDVAHVGEDVTVTFEAPYPGRVLFTAETDELLAGEWLEVTGGRVSWTFEPERFVPNVYLTAFLVKDPHVDAVEAYLPERAFGVTSVTLEPKELTHQVALTAPEEVRSNSRLTVELDLGPVDAPTYATLAAVDEGILSLTGFKSPDPFPSIFTQRALGIETFETVGWTLLVPPGGPTSTEAGDTAGQLGRVQPVKPVALWSGLVEVPADGKLAVDFDVPQYRGQLRVMAVTAGRERMGRADLRVTVRDPLVVQSTLPRFLTHGDDIRVPVHVTNVSGTDRDVDVTIRASAAPISGFDTFGDAPAPVEIVGDTATRLALADGAGETAVFRLKARQPVGAAKLEVVVTSGDLTSTEEVEVPLLPAGPKTRRVERLELEEGENDLTEHLDGWLPLSEKSTLWVTNQPYADALGHLKHLVRYPYGCIEQTSSSTRPLLYLSQLLPTLLPEVKSDEIDTMVQHGVERLISMQTAAGGFSYWPGGVEPVHWGTAYATHVLLEARDLGYSVSEEGLESALEWMERQITNHYEQGQHQNDWYSKNGEPYIHFVLALGGRARKARIERLLSNLSPQGGEEKEHLYMLRAALYLAGDQRYEAQLKRPDTSMVSDERTNGWTFYSDRRRRGFILSTMVDLFGRDQAAEPLVNLVAEALRHRPSRWYTTQELVWSITGLGKYLEAGAAEFEPPVLTANGRRLDPQPQPSERPSSDRTWSLARASEYDELTLEVPEKGEGKLYLILSSEGVRENGDVKVGGEGLLLTRRYLDAAGKPVDWSAHALGDLVYVELKLTNSSGERIANIALVDRVPAGWEIENPRLGRGSAPEWVRPDQLWQADHLDLRDDRLELFGHLDRGKSGAVIYAVRAVTAGRFTIPPVEAEAMYDPRIWARQAGREIFINGPWTRTASVASAPAVVSPEEAVPAP